MDLDQLKVVLDMVSTVTDGALYVAAGWLLYKLLVVVLWVGAAVYFLRGLLQCVRAVQREQDWVGLRERLFPHMSGWYTHDKHRQVLCRVHSLLDERDRLAEELRALRNSQ